MRACFIKSRLGQGGMKQTGQSRSSSGLGLRPFTAATGVRTPYGTPLAGIAQLVEHNLAKVGVASSSLVSRSRLEASS